LEFYKRKADHFAERPMLVMSVDIRPVAYSKTVHYDQALIDPAAANTRQKID